MCKYGRKSSTNGGRKCFLAIIVFVILTFWPLINLDKLSGLFFSPFTKSSDNCQNTISEQDDSRMEPCRFPWETDQDEKCKQFQICFAKNGTFEPRVLVSYPGSGNTWTRYMIEAASGYFTGSVYNDTVLYKAGYLGEMASLSDGTTVVQKYHNFFKGGKDVLRNLFHYRGIIIIRDPFDALVTYRHFTVTRSNHTGFASKKYFQGKDWLNFVKKEVVDWENLIIEWIGNATLPSDYLVVLYENLRNNPAREITRILDYLELPTKENEDRVACLLKAEHVDGLFRRPVSANETAAEFNKTEPVSLGSSQGNLANSVGAFNISAAKLKVIAPITESIGRVNQFLLKNHVLLQLPYKFETSAKKYVYM